MPETETSGQKNSRWEGIGDLRPGDEGEGRGKRRKSTGDTEDGRPAYYDISLLKPPLWTPEVGYYFFLGGLSSGAFSVARLADRFGRGKFRTLTKAGTLIAALAALPCAPLLIVDLGDPKRFHHMLRVWKPSSPMNLGSWTLTVYTLLGGVAAVRELLRVRRGDAPLAGGVRIADETVGLVADVGGVPLGLLLAAYTGVLLSTTSTPVWSRNPWIGVLFSASAVGAGAGAVRLALEVVGDEGPGPDVLAAVETAARTAEAVAHVGFLAHAGNLAKPLTEGSQKAAYVLGGIGAGIVLPELLNRLPAPAPVRRGLRIAAGVLALAGGLALRHAFVAAGRPSAEDPDAARQVTGTKKEDLP